MKQKALYKQLYVRLCRVYARHLDDSPADAVYGFLCSLKFLKEHRYWPHFKHPRSFSEKVCSRMFFDRNSRWTMLSDKLRVREHVAKIVGEQHLIPLLWSGYDPEEIPFTDLPSKFVIKTNHGCGYNIIVKDRMRLDHAEAKRKLKKWLSENFCYASFLGMAWAYKNIKPSILVESFLDDNGKEPEDYKFFCFSGKVEFIQVSFDRYGDASERILDREFNPLDLYNGVKLFSGQIVPPRNYKDMVRVAESLANGFDFIRVDLYSLGDRIYFGELTCYPAGGFARFVPKKYDFVFGEKWKTQ